MEENVMFATNRQTKRILFLLILFWGFILNISYGSAKWSPNSNEIICTQDTYVSFHYDKADNYGGADYINFGFDDMALVQFDFSTLPANLTTLTFYGDCITYGSHTRTVKVYIYPNLNWQELSITGNNCPINATDLRMQPASNANFSFIVVGSTGNISIDILSLKNLTGLITFVFVTNVEDSSWIGLYSKEYSYTSSYSKPCHLIYTVSSNAMELDGSLLIFLLVIGGVIVFILIMRKPNKPSQQVLSPSDRKYCMGCRKELPSIARFCPFCGNTQFYANTPSSPTILTQGLPSAQAYIVDPNESPANIADGIVIAMIILSFFISMIFAYLLAIVGILMAIYALFKKRGAFQIITFIVAIGWFAFVNFLWSY